MLNPVFLFFYEPQRRRGRRGKRRRRIKGGGLGGFGIRGIFANTLD
jgi:hypothetical protein